ncbi:MAG: carboxypeptidase-like regulatory domain-containing protein [Butyricimonas faecihominis]
MGTSTGVNGEYKIVLPSSAKTLIYSFIGYKSEEVEVNGRQKIDVILEDDVKKWMRWLWSLMVPRTSGMLWEPCRL